MRLYQLRIRRMRTAHQVIFKLFPFWAMRLGDRWLAGKEFRKYMYLLCIFHTHKVYFEIWLRHLSNCIPAGDCLYSCTRPFPSLRKWVWLAGPAATLAGITKVCWQQGHTSKSKFWPHRSYTSEWAISSCSSNTTPQGPELTNVTQSYWFL